MSSDLPVFQPNNHSTWLIKYGVITDVNLINKISRIILEFYGHIADKVTLVEQVCETEINSNNFRVTCVKDNEMTRVLVRLYPDHRTPDSIQPVLDTTKFLISHKCKVPVVIATNSGNEFIKTENQYAVVFEFINGNHFRGTLPEIGSIAYALGELDSILLELPVLAPDKYEVADNEVLFSFSVEEWSNLFAIAKKDTSSFGNTVCTHRTLIQKGVESTEKLDTRNLYRGLFHCDLHPHNLLTTGQELISFLDMDSLREMEHARALAFGLHRLVRQHIVFTSINPGDISTKSVQLAEDLFLKEYSKRYTLPQKEIDIIPEMIIHETLRRITYVVKDYYLNKNTAWAGELKKQLAFLVEAESF